MNQTALLRKQLKRQRAQLSGHQQKRLSAQAVQRLQRSRPFRAARNIAVYLPVRGEMDPVTVRNFANPRQQFYLPVLSPYKPHGLIFIRWNKRTRFRLNRFRIPEPLINHRQMKKARSLDLVVTPLLAFDQTGNRLGMGGGFYDRSFAFKAGRPQRHPLLNGFAYQFQQVAELAPQNWDIPLDSVTTESQLTDFRRSAT